MTPRTRPGHRHAGLTVYHAKKTPQQVHFPHKRKTVRRPWPTTHEGSDKRQMVFLPEKMKRRQTQSVSDSDEENEATDLELEAESEHEEQAIHRAAPAAIEPSTKRSNNTSQHEESDEKGPDRSSSKRRRTQATAIVKRTWRRQSTMTQLMDGRRPLSDVEEPEFKPVKRRSNANWNGKGRCKSKDQKQRTLTQMIPGMQPREITSDQDVQDFLSDLDAQESDSQSYHSAVVQRLLVQRGYEDTDATIIVKQETGGAKPSITQFEDDESYQSAVVARSIEMELNDEGDDSYRPTQYINAPSSRPGRRSRRSPKMTSAIGSSSTMTSPNTQAAHQSRLSIPNTPEKRRICEIPSSQSPAVSPLSTQVSPQKLHRSPLHTHIDKSMPASFGPPQRMRVAFQDPCAPPNLKKFESTIQDSEDEHDVIEDNLSSSDGLPSRTEVSPESGDICTRTRIAWKDRDEEQAHGTMNGSQTPPNCSVISTAKSLPNTLEIPHPIPKPDETYHREALPSTSLVNQDNSLNKDAEGYTSSSQCMKLADPQSVSADQLHTVDLDDEPILLPKFPPAPHETQQFHSNKPEQQLQHEWPSYSQHTNTRPSLCSSMYVTHSTSRHSITQSMQRTIAPPAQATAHVASQATTLDEVTQITPKKSQTQQLASATTPPHSLAGAHSVASPNPPPPLLIPSSFPSQANAAMQGWSSPVYGRTQEWLRPSQFGMSLEDFSIPPPPPADENWIHDDSSHCQEG